MIYWLTTKNVSLKDQGSKKLSKSTRTNSLVPYAEQNKSKSYLNADYSFYPNKSKVVSEFILLSSGRVNKTN